MRIVFLGSGEFGLPTLERLSQAHEVSLVVTQPDRPAGRKRKLTPTPVGAWAEQNHLSVIKPENVNAPEIVQRIEAEMPDLIFVVAFGQWISKKVRKLAKLEIINLHASLLPRWRGAGPINWAVLAGDAEAGVTIMTVVKAMDAGDMLGKASMALDPMMTAGELHDELSKLGPELSISVIEQLEAGTAMYESQDTDLVTEARKLSRDDAQLDLGDDPVKLQRWIHGLNPWPGVAMIIEDDNGVSLRLKIGRVRAINRHCENTAPGHMVDVGVFACGRGALELLEVQPAGKKMMSWEDFARGHVLNKPRLRSID